jgi:peptidoglycan hydrolase-like protein with peptidoglycan-binding domain
MNGIEGHFKCAGRIDLSVWAGEQDEGRNPLVGRLAAGDRDDGDGARSPRPYAAESVGGVEDVDATPSLIREIQFMLLRLGIDPGPIDGVVGPQTIRAFRKFQEQSGVPVADLANGGRISVSVLARLRGDASRVMFGNEKRPEAPPPAIAAQPAAPPPPPPQPAAQAPDRFAACKFSPEDFRIGATAYTPDKYLQVGFDGSSARAVSMLKDRLNEARQIAGNIGGSALTEVQRQSRVLDYFSCRLKIEQASEK